MSKQYHRPPFSEANLVMSAETTKAAKIPGPKIFSSCQAGLQTAAVDRGPDNYGGRTIFIEHKMFGSNITRDLLKGFHKVWPRRFCCWQKGFLWHRTRSETVCVSPEP
jgi:hypothetical protein